MVNKLRVEMPFGIITPISILCFLSLLLIRPAYSQTVIIGAGTTSGPGPIYVHETGTGNQSRSVHVVRQSNLASSGVANGSAITEWGYKKTSTTELVGTNQWELKVYLKNVDYDFLAGADFNTLGNGSTLVYQNIINGDTFPVEDSYWMWQMQNYFEYTGLDILCIVEWVPQQSTFNNITNLMAWERSLSGSTNILIPGTWTGTMTTTLSSGGYATRISFANTLFSGTVTGGTIEASVVNANAGAPFTLLASNLSYGVDMLYQWQKSPAGLNQWTNIGPESLYSSLPTVLQDTPTDYRLRSTCSTNGQTAMSNIVSIGQKANVIFADPHLKTAFIRADPSTDNVMNLADTYFKPDVDDDGEIQLTEALQVGSAKFIASATTELGGMGAFENIRSFGFFSENMSDIVVPSMPNLESFGCGYCSIESVTFGALPQLESLGFTFNNLTEINLDNTPALRELNLSNNLFQTFTAPESAVFESLEIKNNILSELIIQNVPNFNYLDCSNNQLTSLNVESTREQFSGVRCSNNQLTSFTISGMQAVYNLHCDNNQVQSLDLSQIRVYDLNCSNNNLSTLNIRNNDIEHTLNFAGNPDLSYICADYPQVETVRALASTQGYSQMNVNDYCSFEHFGTERIMTGNSRYSASGPCDVNSIAFPHLRLKWSESYDENYFLDYFFTNSLGELDVQMPFATQSILEPILEIPEYFNVSPMPFAFDFQVQPSPIVQDFCITPNGVHHDVETLIFPLNDARPGFDANYTIVLRNKGTEPSSGVITLNYEEAVMDLLLTDPIATASIPGQLSWTYTNLLPFETRSILLSFSLNGPMESPPLNSGDDLVFNLVASPEQIDENPINNTISWNQFPVNSHDPNDKTCLEGNVVGSEQIGEYVHYVIRFENTGTASAINVVVNDLLDAEHFDVSSLVLLNSSHPTVLRQRGNAVEFIFEGIDLPFEGELAKGFVLFKVRLRDDLVLGNTFSNQAEIYFDYNYPIITNNETTAIQNLNTSGFVMDSSVVIYPNPAASVMNVKSSSMINTVQVIDVHGRILATSIVNDAFATIDISPYNSGIYFIKVTTDKGIGIEKILKN